MGSQKKNNNSSSSIDSPLSYFFYTTYMYVRYYYKSKMCIDASKLNLFQPLMISVQDDFILECMLYRCKGVYKSVDGALCPCEEH